MRAKRFRVNTIAFAVYDPPAPSLLPPARSPQLPAPPAPAEAAGAAKAPAKAFAPPLDLSELGCVSSLGKNIFCGRDSALFPFPIFDSHPPPPYSNLSLSLSLSSVSEYFTHFQKPHCAMEKDLLLVLASKRMPRNAFPLGTFRVKRVTALNFLPDFYLAGALRTAGMLVDERAHGQSVGKGGQVGERGGGGSEGPSETSSSIALERYRAVGRGAGARRLLCLLVSPSYEMQRWIADHLPHAWTVFSLTVTRWVMRSRPCFLLRAHERQRWQQRQAQRGRLRQ